MLVFADSPIFGARSRHTVFGSCPHVVRMELPMHRFPVMTGWLSRVALILIVMGTVGLISPIVAAGEFRAASARADLTPAGLEIMWGYADRKGPATGTHDPLYAKILLLDDSQKRLALVTLDLGRSFGNDSMNFVRERVARSAGVTQVFFFASHTHSAPAIDDSYAEGQRPAWETAALERIAKAIEEAAAKLQPALIGTGDGAVLIGHNRRLVQADGSVKMLWRNSSKEPTHPLDPRVGVLRVDRQGGGVIAVLVNYACHPVVYGPDNREYSADYPGAMAEVVERASGPDAVCLFLQGAAGDINPYFDKSRLEEGAEKLMQETGRQLGDEALRVAKSIVPSAPKTPELQFALETRRFGMRYDPAVLLEKLKAANPRPEFLARYRAHLSTPMDCPVAMVLINREIALLGIPGEPFVEFGINFRDRSPARYSLFAGYANGHFGYFPTIRAAVAGGYGAEGITARSEVGTGEAMVDMGIIRLYEMLGLLKKAP
jgi:neutral ceramidase